MRRAQAEVVEALQRMPSTAHELAERLGISHGAALLRLRTLRLKGAVELWDEVYTASRPRRVWALKRAS